MKNLKSSYCFSRTFQTFPHIVFCSFVLGGLECIGVGWGSGHVFKDAVKKQVLRACFVSRWVNLVEKPFHIVPSFWLTNLVGQGVGVVPVPCQRPCSVSHPSHHCTSACCVFKPRSTYEERLQLSGTDPHVSWLALVWHPDFVIAIWPMALGCLAGSQSCYQIYVTLIPN